MVVGSNPTGGTSYKGAAEGCGVALQASCLEGFDTLGLHQNYGPLNAKGIVPLGHDLQAVRGRCGPPFTKVSLADTLYKYAISSDEEHCLTAGDAERNLHCIENLLPGECSW